VSGGTYTLVVELAAGDREVRASHRAVRDTPADTGNP